MAFNVWQAWWAMRHICERTPQILRTAIDAESTPKCSQLERTMCFIDHAYLDRIIGLQLHRDNVICERDLWSETALSWGEKTLKCSWFDRNVAKTQKAEGNRRQLQSNNVLYALCSSQHLGTHPHIHTFRTLSFYRAKCSFSGAMREYVWLIINYVKLHAPNTVAIYNLCTCERIVGMTFCDFRIVEKQCINRIWNVLNSLCISWFQIAKHEMICVSSKLLCLVVFSADTHMLVSNTNMWILHLVRISFQDMYVHWWRVRNKYYPQLFYLFKIVSIRFDCYI